MAGRHSRHGDKGPAKGRGSDPVKVAYASNQSEAELIQGLLKEYGIPSYVRRNAGFDVPDFLAAGPRDVMVPRAALERAQEVLRKTNYRAESDGYIEFDQEAPPLHELRADELDRLAADIEAFEASGARAFSKTSGRDPFQIVKIMAVATAIVVVIALAIWFATSG